jgi:hypothetical protein
MSGLEGPADFRPAICPRSCDLSLRILTETLKQIRCPRGAAAEMIAAKLDRKLRDHILNSKDNLFSSQARPAGSAAGTPTSRPVLIILDRNVDLIPMLSHSWTYQSLCFDIFKVAAGHPIAEMSALLTQFAV